MLRWRKSRGNGVARNGFAALVLRHSSLLRSNRRHFLAKREQFLHPYRAWAPVLLCQGRVNFYNILADGYHAPLTKTQIAELFHAGLFGHRQPCKRVEEKEWRTIDELFPLLRYETPKKSLYQPTDVHGSESRHPVLAILILILAMSAVSLAGYFALRSGMHWSRNAIAAIPATNPQAPVAISSLPVDNTIVSATTLANLPQLDIDLPQAGPTLDLLDEEKRAPKKRPSALKTASTQSRKSARNKRRPERM